MSVLLEARDLRFSYAPGVEVLRIERLQVHEGEVVGLVGANGSGKSTLLKLLSFVETCSDGAILFRGVAARPFSEHVRFHVSFLPQEAYLLKRSVFENVAYGLRLRGEKKCKAWVEAALEMVGLPAHFCKRAWYTLSGGEARRVCLAARLALRPRCLLLDEPTAGVDLASEELIKQALLKARHEWGSTLIVAAHHHAWLEELCGRLLFLHQGRILENGLENIFFGPWLPAEEGHVEKNLENGERLLAVKPDAGQSCCRVEPGSIVVGNGLGENHINRFSGTIVKMDQAQGDQKVRLRVRCAGGFFAVEMPREQAKGASLLPGELITISFAANAAVWL